MERLIQFVPAWDRRSADPSKDYGVHGVELRFVLKGEKGAVQFVLYTNWQLPHVREELDRKNRDHFFCRPQPADLGYHSPVPLHEWQSPCNDSCEYLDGKPCYYDGSSLNAMPVYGRLLREGDEGVWNALEDYYHSIFEEGEHDPLLRGRQR